MKVLKNLHKVIDFVNPHNENLRQSTIRQKIVSSLKKVPYFLEQSQILTDGDLFKQMERNALQLRKG